MMLIGDKETQPIVREMAPDALGEDVSANTGIDSCQGIVKEDEVS